MNELIKKVDEFNIEQKYKELCGLLSELVDLIEGYLNGEYKIDSFTLQPAQTFLGRNTEEKEAREQTEEEWDEEMKRAIIEETYGWDELEDERKIERAIKKEKQNEINTN